MDITFTSKHWKKNWAGGWSLLSCEYLGYQYTKQLKEVLGVSLEEALFISHDGISSCYFLEEYKKTFGTFLANKAINDPSSIGTWAKDLITTTDRVLMVIDDLMKKEVSSEHFDTFVQAMWDYGVPHRIIKMAVDYLPPELLKDHLNVLEEARVHAEPVYEMTEKYMRYIAGQIATQKKTRPELVLAMTKVQFEVYLKNGSLPEQATLEEQYKNAALYIIEGTSELHSGAVAVSETEKALVENVSAKNLTGQVAYAGKVRGRVRIILDPLPEKPFEEGDILVTGMTRPDYLPYIKKSAGFITDAGGILSHAAISARELKKPCIIGTEIGTKTLKDGDMVEIDAEKGVVNIIE
jgi:phosphohistidine swiveling domain-containing protein